MRLRRLVGWLHARYTRKSLAKVQLHRKVCRHTRKYMKIILKGSQRHIHKHILYPHRHRHSLRFFGSRMNFFPGKCEIGMSQMGFPVRFKQIYVHFIWNSSFLVHEYIKWYSVLYVLQYFGNAQCTQTLRIACSVRSSFLSLLCRCVSLRCKHLPVYVWACPMLFCAICILYTMCLECDAYFLTSWLRFIRLAVLFCIQHYPSLSPYFGWVMYTAHFLCNMGEYTAATPSALSIVAYSV